MSGTAVHTLSNERIQQLLAVIGSRPGENTAPEEATEYNWFEPHCFSRPQLVMLGDFTKKMATAASEKFSGFCRSKFEVAVTSTTFHFASEFLHAASESECRVYYLPFDTDGERACGFIGIPEKTAAVWARQLLGDSESDQESDITLSQLEESLLLDLISALMKAFSALQAGVNFTPAGRLLKGQWPLKVHDTVELCRISFDVKKIGTEGGSSAYLLIVCEALNPVVGKDGQTSDAFSAEEISKAVLNHLQTVPVTITAQLVSVELAFGEMAALQVDDILLLDKKVDQPVDLMINGRTVYQGWPVQSAGKYAVAVASMAPKKTS
jgi:flagellar motor switch protein FliM